MNDKLLKNKEKYILKPSQILIDNWKYWIAKEIVSQFKTNKIVKSKLSDILQLLDFNTSDLPDEFFDQFKNKILSEKEECKSTSELNQAKIKLDKAYRSTFSDKLETIVNNLKTEYISKLQDYLLEDLQKASPQNLMILLKEISKMLLAQRSQVENKKVNLINQKKSADLAYDNLVAIDDYEVENESIWNALSLIYKLQFDIHISEILSEIILNLIQLTQNYYNMTNRAFLFLEELEDSLSKKCLVKLSSLPIFTYLNLINIDEQQDLINQNIGHKINHWGDNNISIQMLEDEIFKNIDALTRKIFFDFQVEFLENTIIEEQ